MAPEESGRNVAQPPSAQSRPTNLRCNVHEINPGTKNLGTIFLETGRAAMVPLDLIQMQL